MKAGFKVLKNASPEEVLLQAVSVDEATGCWNWTAALDRYGYGITYDRSQGAVVKAHRHSWAVFVGAIPTGAQIDHLCRNRRCINPEHLEPVTARVNVLRGFGPPAINARKERCVNGHELVGDNCRTTGRRRQCRTCAREQTRAYRLRKKGAGA